MINGFHKPFRISRYFSGRCIKFIGQPIKLNNNSFITPEKFNTGEWGPGEKKIQSSFCPSGETEKVCTLKLVDDSLYEEDEELRLVLGSPRSDSPLGASVGAQNETLVRINDHADST